MNSFGLCWPVGFLATSPFIYSDVEVWSRLKLR